MKREEFSEKIQKLANEIQIEIEKDQINQFYAYMELLLEWNQKINLTAITNPEEIILKHFIDSLTIAKYIEKGKKVVDVGTGAGFPGIPLKIIKKDLTITLLDSLNKRIIFLEEVIEKLKLEKIETIHARVEDFAKEKKYRESYDIVTSRAVANLATLSEYMIPLVKVGGTCICMKGMTIEEEIQKSKNAINQLGGTIEKVEKLTLPQSDMERNIILIKKQKQTPNKYPRKPGIPAKDPIM